MCHVGAAGRHSRRPRRALDPVRGGRRPGLVDVEVDHQRPKRHGARRDVRHPGRRFRMAGATAAAKRRPDVRRRVRRGRGIGADAGYRPRVPWSYSRHRSGNHPLHGLWRDRSAVDRPMAPRGTELRGLRAVGRRTVLGPLGLARADRTKLADRAGGPVPGHGGDRGPAEPNEWTAARRSLVADRGVIQPGVPIRSVSDPLAKDGRSLGPGRASTGRLVRVSHCLTVASHAMARDNRPTVGGRLFPDGLGISGRVADLGRLDGRLARVGAWSGDQLRRAGRFARAGRSANPRHAGRVGWRVC